ncbi:MAG: response regulator [Candidatus Omnitrophota bacterium]
MLFDGKQEKDFIKYLHEFVKKQISAGLYKSNILEKLVEMGVEQDEASRLLEEMERSLQVLRKKVILIVEDEKHTRMLLEEILRAWGYQAFSAADGEEGFQAAEKVRPDLIITDVLMPRMQGNELIKKLRGTLWGYDIPIIVLTQRDLMKDYFDTLGVEGFIAKPFQTDDLLGRIKQVFGREPPRRAVGEN